MKAATITLVIFGLITLSFAQVSPLFLLGTLRFDPLKHANGLPVDLLKVDGLTNTTTSAFNFFLPANETLLDLYLAGAAFDQNEDVYYFVVNTVVGERITSALYAIDCFNLAFAFQNVTLNGPVFWDITITSKGEILFLTQAGPASKTVNLNRYNPKTNFQKILLQNVVVAEKAGSTAYIENAKTLLLTPFSFVNPSFPVITMSLDYTTSQIPMDTNTVFEQSGIVCSNFTDSCFLIQSPIIESGPTYSHRIVNYIPFTNQYQLICPITQQSIDFEYTTYLNGFSSLDAPNNVLAYVINSAAGNAEPNPVSAILFVDIDDCSENWVLQPHGKELIYFGPEFAWSLPL